ncbi:MAG: hypothetical protein U5L11_09485 [Arhodomonas sp.]|nr:hypothetical protein [Arhodomonas sp.]
MLQIHNSLTRRKETFEPMEPGKVRIYVCGMTVYDYCHLGHARAMVVFDTVVRHLRRLRLRGRATCATSPMWTTRSSAGLRRAGSRPRR